MRKVIEWIDNNHSLLDRTELIRQRGKISK